MHEETLGTAEALTGGGALVTAEVASSALVGLASGVEAVGAGSLAASVLLEKEGGVVAGLASVLGRAGHAVSITAGNAGLSGVEESSSASLDALVVFNLEVTKALKASVLIAFLATFRALDAGVLTSVVRGRALSNASVIVEDEGTVALFARSLVLFTFFAVALGALDAFAVLSSEVVGAGVDAEAGEVDGGGFASNTGVLVGALEAGFGAGFAGSTLSEELLGAVGNAGTAVEDVLRRAGLALVGLAVDALEAAGGLAGVAGFSDDKSGSVAGDTVGGSLVEEEAGEASLAVSFVIAVSAVGGAVSASVLVALVEADGAFLKAEAVVEDGLGRASEALGEVGGVANFAVAVSALVAVVVSKGESDLAFGDSFGGFNDAHELGLRSADESIRAFRHAFPISVLEHTDGAGSADGRVVHIA